MLEGWPGTADRRKVYDALLVVCHHLVMQEDPLWCSLSLADRLRLTAFEAGLARFPPSMLAVLHDVAARLEKASEASPLSSSKQDALGDC